MMRTLLGALLAVTTLPAQSPAPGYASDVAPLPLTTSLYQLVDPGHVTFDGTRLELHIGRTTFPLLTFSAPVFGSFAVQVTKDALLFGESKNHEVWLVPLDPTKAPRLLNTVTLNYAATAYNDDWALISARTGGFPASSNDIVAINLNTGAVDPIAIVPGASGPLLRDRFGNLIYATGSATFPPPAGSVDVLEFSAAKIASAFGPAVLTTNDAATIYAGLDAAGSMALDGDADLFLTDWMNSTVVELSDIHTAQPQARVLLTYSGALSASSVQFVPGATPGLAQFEPFQSQGTGTLWIRESDFSSKNQIHKLSPRRPTTQTSIPSPIPAGRAFAVEIDGAPAGGTAFVALGLGSTRREVTIPLPTYEQVILWSDALLQPLDIRTLTISGGGGVQLPLANPGFPMPLEVTFQAFFIDGTGQIAGSSWPRTTTLN